MRARMLTILSITFGAWIIGQIDKNPSFAQSLTSNDEEISAAISRTSVPNTDENRYLGIRTEFELHYSCNVFTELDQRKQCLRKQSENNNPFNQEDDGELGDFDLEVTNDNLSLGEDNMERQKKSEAVLNHLYENIYRFNSGVFNYEKKIN